RRVLFRSAGASFRNDAQNNQCCVESTPEQTGSPALSVQRTHGLTELSKKPRTPSQPIIVGFSRYVGLSSTHRSVHPEAENFLGRHSHHRPDHQNRRLVSRVRSCLPSLAQQLAIPRC